MRAAGTVETAETAEMDGEINIEEKKRHTAIVLAAGSGKRMQSAEAKQYMMLGDRPVLWYSLQAVEQSKVIDDCILVTGAGDISRVRREFVERYGFSKVDIVTAGGGERYESVYRALLAMEAGELSVPNRDGYVFIHDGARPFLSEKLLQDTYREVRLHHACAAAVPVKDTVKIADENGFAVQTPLRSRVWTVQTPQVFDTELILCAYRKLFAQPPGERREVTDDAMVAEEMLGIPVKLVKSDYRNIKLTTPEDLRTAEGFLS